MSQTVWVKLDRSDAEAWHWLASHYVGTTGEESLWDRSLWDRLARATGDALRGDRTLARDTAPERGDEVVLRLTREEAQELAKLAKWGVAALDTSVRTPLRDKLRAALDQGDSDPAPAGREENA